MKQIPKNIELAVQALLKDYCTFDVEMLYSQESKKKNGLTNVYTRKELANALKISVMTVDRAIHSKALQPIRVGSRVMFTEDAIEKWLSVSTRKQNRKLNERLA